MIKEIDVKTGKVKTRAWSKKEKEANAKAVKTDNTDVAYDIQRQAAYPTHGDQLDIAYKDRVARQLAAGKARKALEDGHKDKALEILIDAIDAGADADGVDGRITAVKSAIKKPEV